VANRLKNKIMAACSSHLPACLESHRESLRIMRECLQNKKGLRLYQMEKMAQLEVLDEIDSPVEFDPKLASSYTYKYDRGDVHPDHYVYTALEAVCYECGCFLWKDIGMRNTFALQFLFTI